MVISISKINESLLQIVQYLISFGLDNLNNSVRKKTVFLEISLKYCLSA